MFDAYERRDLLEEILPENMVVQSASTKVNRVA